MERWYSVVVYCGVCGCRLGKAILGSERVDIICMDCADENDEKRMTIKVATSS